MTKEDKVQLGPLAAVIAAHVETGTLRSHALTAALTKACAEAEATGGGYQHLVQRLDLHLATHTASRGQS